MPSLPSDLAAILSFQAGYNTALVLAGTAILGMAAGVAGMFLTLRRQALASDAVSHATLPGIALGFLAAYALGLDGGRNLPMLLVGAAFSGLTGIVLLQWLVSNTKLPPDAATSTILGTFYALGIALLSFIQTMEDGSRAGLDTFLLGQTAAMTLREAVTLAICAIIVLCLSFLLLKELGAACFDPAYTDTAGFRMKLLDGIIMGMMLAIVCIGLKVVGLVLVVALLIVPPLAARYWCRRFLPAVLLSGAIGAFVCYAGAAYSALESSVPTGAVIVLIAFVVFMAGFLFGPVGGLSARLLKKRGT